MRHLEEIVATPVVVAEPGDSCLRFPSTLKLNDLYNDFKITIEIYSLQTQPEILPHEIKYHINHGTGCSTNNNNGNKKVSIRVRPDPHYRTGLDQNHIRERPHYQAGRVWTFRNVILIVTG